MRRFRSWRAKTVQEHVFFSPDWVISGIGLHAGADTALQFARGSACGQAILRRSVGRRRQAMVMELALLASVTATENLEFGGRGPSAIMIYQDKARFP